MHAVELTTDDELLVDHYRLHWIELGVREDEVRENWRDEALRFIRVARSRDNFGAFSAKADGASIGSACCQLARPLYPAFRKADAVRLGYVWGVYVQPESRGHGVGRALVTACMSHLRGLGCERVLLHTGEQSVSLYRRLGFEPTNELARLL